jgi:hypothetical protein
MMLHFGEQEKDEHIKHAKLTAEQLLVISPLLWPI